MSFKKLLKRLKRALPVILAHAPAVIAAFVEVKRAVKSQPQAAPDASEA